MNLKEIRSQVLLQTDYGPADAAYYRYVEQMINSTYKELWDAKEWVFSTKTVQMRAFPDRSSSQFPSVTLTILGHRITASTSIFLPSDVGQSIQFGSSEYEIASYQDPTVIFTKLPILTSTSTPWTIKYRTYFLPLDCVEVMSVTWPNAPLVGAPNIYASTQGIPARLNDLMNLDQQVTSNRPNFYYPLPDPYMRAPEDRNVPVATFEATAADHVPEGDYEFTYSYCLIDETYNFIPTQPIYGPESALYSGTCSITISPSDFGKIVISIPQPLGPNAKFAPGYRAVVCKVYQVFRTGDGRVEAVEVYDAVTENPIFAQDPTSTGIATADITGSSFLSIGLPVRAPSNGGRSKAIAFWPRVNTVDFAPFTGGLGSLYGLTYFDVRYIYRPEELLSESDSPEMPEEFHLLIVDMVCSRIALRHEQLAAKQLFDRSIAERRRFLESRYGSNQDTAIQRGQSMTAGKDVGPWPWPGLITYTGR